MPTGHTASTRNPSTPRSNQNRSVSANNASTAGWRWSKSGWYGVNVPRYQSGSSPPTARPHRPAERGQPVVRRIPAVPAGAEPEPGPLVAAGAGAQRGLEPRVLVAAVVRHDVEQRPGCRARGRRRRARRTPRGRRTPARCRRSRRRRSRGHAAVTGRSGTARRRRRRARRCARAAAGGPRGRRCRHRRRRRTSARTPGRRRRAATSARSCPCWLP